mmetsp:Transcript_48014/g.109023  ORF Transcript_48014/g.109023 Transcript_48014/m.109023 type:complete len:80 (+) Transcript_48014:2294-2533(+)
MPTPNPVPLHMPNTAARLLSLRRFHGVPMASSPPQGFGASFAKPMSRRALEGMVRRFCSGLGGNSAALVSSDEEVTERT